MKGREAFEIPLHWGGENIVGGILGGPNGVPTSSAWRSAKNYEESIGRWLDLICYLCGTVRELNRSRGIRV